MEQQVKFPEGSLVLQKAPRSQRMYVSRKPVDLILMIYGSWLRKCAEHPVADSQSVTPRTCAASDRNTFSCPSSVSRDPETDSNWALFPGCQWPGWTRMDIKADTISAKMDTNGHECTPRVDTSYISNAKRTRMDTDVVACQIGGR